MIRYVQATEKSHNGEVNTWIFLEVGPSHDEIGKWIVIVFGLAGPQTVFSVAHFELQYIDSAATSK